MELLLIPIVLTGAFLMPFLLVLLDPKPTRGPTHRAEAVASGADHPEESQAGGSDSWRDP
jgi:hypothetical protein